MKFSIVIPVRNNRSDLIGLLQTIEQQSYAEPFETLIVDQSDIKEAPIEVSSGSCRWFRMEGVGLSRSRNLAFKNASGDYVVCADVDVRFKIDALKILDGITNAHPEYDAICGTCLNIEDGKPYSRYSSPEPEDVNFRNYDCCLASAMAIKRTVLSEVGLLDEHLGAGMRYGSSEETDLVLRILQHGGRLLYQPRYEVLHPSLKPQGMPLRAWIRKHYLYGMGRGAMLRKHLRIKPAWAVKNLLLALSKPAAGILLEVLRLQGRQALRYTVSIIGRIHGFISYKP